MKNKIVLFSLLTTIIMLGACSTQSFLVKGGGHPQPNKKGWNHFFIQGVGQTGQIDAAAICGGADKVAKVEAKLTFGNWVLQQITFGIYTPRQYKVYCTTAPEPAKEQK